MSAASEASPWEAAMRALSAAGERLAAKVEGRVDASDVHLTMLGTLMNGYLNQLSADASHPQFLPCTGFFQRLGSPNPDTVYRRAPIDAQAAYRLTGERGDVAEATLMAFAEPSMRSWPPFDLSDVARGPDGAFDVIVSAERPAGYAGDWWKLEPGMSCLWLRSVSDRWGETREPRIAINRLGATPRRKTPPERILQGLLPLATSVERIVDYGIRHVEELADQGFLNRLKAVDYGAAGGVPLQHYHEGLFELGEDQALLVEARMPADWRYFSWSLTDRMLVTLDWTHAQSSLNRTQASVGADGVLRVAICGRDPGLRNWMDTAGHRSGVIQCRSVGSTRAPSFETRLIALEAIAHHLPAGAERVTPAQREVALLERRTGAQLRSLW